MHVTIKEVADKIADLVMENIEKRLDIPNTVAFNRQPSTGMTSSIGMTGPAASVAKSKPVKCKEYWINSYSHHGSVFAYTSKRGADKPGTPHNRVTTRVIEPLPYAVIQKALFEGYPMSDQIMGGAGGILERLQDLGMVKDKE